MLTARFALTILEPFYDLCERHNIPIIALVTINDQIIMVTVMAERELIELLITAGYIPEDVTDEKERQ